MKLDKREVTGGNAFVDKEDTNVSLVTIYGVTKKDLDGLLQKHNIQVLHVEMPGLCRPDEMLTEGEMRRQEQTPAMNSQNTDYSNTRSSYYYYQDPTTDLCCYYACYPRTRYRSYSTSNTACCASNSSNTNCDCNDTNSDNDDFAIFAIILLLIAAIGVLIFFGPSIIAAGLVLIEFAISGILLLFNILTLGIYRDDLSRSRIRIQHASHADLNNFLLDILDHHGLPKMPGYWTEGFVLLRYGATFFITGLILLVGMFFIDVSSAKAYIIPAVVIIASLLGFFFGEYLIKRKISEVKQELLQST